MASGNTDKRIMQMQFDNKEFELNIKKSQKSVEDFKKAMDFEETSKGLHKFSDVLDKLHLTDAFGKMGDNLQKLTDKFTGLGTMSERVLSQIRGHLDSMMARLSGFIDSMTSVQVSAGMDKYEMLNKSVQTIKAATGESEKEVYDVLKRLNDYTDQTSYNFSDMASNIGKFTSVGIDLRSAERQMEGIANWAARSGAGINEASRAMYNLSQAMGVGKLTKIDWKSIENANMATKEFKEQLIDAGVMAGTLIEEIDKKTGKITYKTAKSLGKQIEVNFQNVGDTLSKGWATRDVLSSTLERYYYDDLYYENEAQEVLLRLDEAQKKTFNDMMESGNSLDASEYKTLKDMGVMTDETTKKILDMAVTHKKLTSEVKDDGKVIYKATDKAGKQIEFTIDNIEDSLKTGWFDKKLGEMASSINNLARESYESAQKCLTFSDVINAWKDQISTGWMKSFKIIFGDLSESMEFFSNVCNKVGEAIDKIITMRNDLLQGWSDAGGRQSLLDIILGDYGKKTATGAYGFLDMLEGIGKIVYDGLVDFLSLFADPVERANFKDNPGHFKAWLAKRMALVTEDIENFLKKIRDFFNEEIDVGGQTKSRLEIIHEIVQGIAGAMKLAWDVLVGTVWFIGEIGRQLGPGLDDILVFFGELGKAIFGTAEEASDGNKIHKFFEDLAVIVTPITTSLNDLIHSILDLLRIILGLEDGTGTFSDTLHSVGDIIKIIADIIAKVASPIIDFFTKIIDAISKLVKGGINGSTIKEFGSDLGDAFGEMMNKFADNLPESMGFLSDWIHNLFGSGKQEVETEANNLFGLIGSVNKQADKTQKDVQKNAGGNSGASGLLGLLTGTNVAVWVGVAGLIAVTALINKAKKTVGQIGGFFGSLGSALKDGFKIKYEQDDSASRFLKIAKGLALIAASIVVLGLIPLNALIQGGIAMLAIMGAMFGLMFLLKKTQKSLSVKEQLAFTAQILAIAGSAAMLGIAVGILALAITPFALMSWEQFGRAMAGLGGVLLELIGFMYLIKVLNINTKKFKIAGIVSFAIGVGILAKSIIPFAYMSWDEYAKAMAGLGGVLLELIACMKIMSSLKINTKSLFGFGGFALSVGILVMAIKPFANMNWDQYGRAMAGLGGVLLQLIAFMLITKYLPIGTKQLGGFIAFALSISILVMAIRPFADMNWEQYAKAMAGLGGVLLQLIAFMLLTSFMPIGTKQLGGFIGFALSIALLIMAIKPFTEMSWDQYAKAMAGLGGVLLELVAAMFLIKTVNGKDSPVKLAGFLLFAFSIKMLIDAIMPFTRMDPTQYMQAISGLAWILIEIVGFMGLLKLIGSNDVQVLGLAGFAGGISMLINALKPFLDLPSDDWQPVLKALVGLGGVLLIMAGFMALMKKIKPGNTTKQMLQLAIFAGIFAAIVGSFAVAMLIVKDMDWKTIGAFAVGITAIIAALAISMVALGNIPVSTAIKGMLVLAAGIVVIIGVLSYMLPLLMTNIASGFSEAMGQLILVADMIGMFVSQTNGVNQGELDKTIGIFDQLTYLVAGFSGFSISNTGLTNFYNALFRLGTGVENFNKHTSTLGDMEQNEGIKFIRILAGCADELNIIEGMDMERFRTNIAGLGGALMIYAKGAKEAGTLQPGESTDVVGAVELLQSLSSALSEAGGFEIPENMPDDKVLGSFGTSLAALAGSFELFEEAGGKLNGGYEKGKKALEFFKNLKEDLIYYDFGANLQAVQQEFSNGENLIQPDVLTTLGADIEALGSAMATFASSTTITDEATKEIKPLDFTQAITALDSFVSLQERLPTVGGVITGLLFGDEMTLGKLSGQLVELGAGLNELSLAVSGKGEKAAEKGYTGLDEASVDLAESTVQRMIDLLTIMKQKLPSIGGLIKTVGEFVSGHDFTFSDLKDQMVQLGTGLGELGKGINAGNWSSAEATKNAFDALDSIISIMLHFQALATTGAELESFTGLTGFDIFEHLNDLLKFLTEGASYDEYTTGSALDKMITVIQQIDTAMAEYSKTVDDMESIQGRVGIFRTFAEALNYLSNSNMAVDWTVIGTNLTEGVAKGITNGVENIILAIKEDITKAHTEAQNVEGVSWATLGENIAAGIAAGMTDSISLGKVIGAAATLVITAFDSACATADSNSPSLLFAELGSYLGQGLSVGMLDSKKNVAVAAGEMTGVAIDKASEAIGLISRIMAEDVDANPTISPVLDLTNLENGMDQFARDAQGRQIALNTSGIALNAGSIGLTASGSFDMNQLKPDYNGLYARMDALGQQVSNLGTAISKIKIVLNSGVVAGSVTDDVDRNLGRKIFYAGRNN